MWQIIKFVLWCFSDILAWKHLLCEVSLISLLSSKLQEAKQISNTCTEPIKTRCWAQRREWSGNKWRHESRWFIWENYWCHNLLIQRGGEEKRKTVLKLILHPPTQRKAFTTDLDTSSVSERCLTACVLTVSKVYLTTPGYAGRLCTTGYCLIIRFYSCAFLNILIHKRQWGIQP